VKNLAAFLSEAPENAVSSSEMDKLWKGIFYCLYYLDGRSIIQLLILNRFLDVRQAARATSISERTCRTIDGHHKHLRCSGFSEGVLDGYCTGVEWY
jgi:hypothetical protein